MKRHELRKQAMISIYQFLLLEEDINEVLENNYTYRDEYFTKVIINVSDKKDEFIQKINDLLDNWTFDRLGYPESAILLLGVSELDIKELDKSIIINEAIELSKEYGNEESYPLINKVLDKYE